MDRRCACLRAAAGLFVLALSASGPLIACEEHKPAYAEAVDSGPDTDTAPEAVDSGGEARADGGADTGADTAENVEGAADAESEGD